ncbi:hypothetical protein [Parasitella parasitica]|uniref:Uncharacterized protein n=1 Tax=Parasitella parasitica TaxID=35722 RepID=A0A0B7NUU7_9FUNG|nr:hypothetical protein [Parasitella parasitica]
MFGSPSHLRAEAFDEFETINSEEGFTNADFSVSAPGKGSDSTSNTCVDANNLAQKRSKRRKRTSHEEEEEVYTANEEMSSTQTSTQADVITSTFTVVPPVRHQAGSSPSSPTFAYLSDVKSEDSLFPFTQLSQAAEEAQDSRASQRQEVQANQRQEIQASQPQEAPVEESRQHTETNAHGSNTSGHRRNRRAHIHIYFFQRREDQTPTRAVSSFMDHLLTGLKILLIMAILYYIFTRDTASCLNKEAICYTIVFLIR